MNALSSSTVNLHSYLLPGFVAAAVFFSLTPFPRREPFERTVQALIFTILIQATVAAVRSGLFLLGTRGVVLGSWRDNVTLVGSVLLALGVGIFGASINNRDSIHGLLRKLGVTHQTSYASDWYGALSHGNAYVVLHLNGERRRYGWPAVKPPPPPSAKK